MSREGGSILELIKQGNIWQLQQEVAKLKAAESQYLEFSQYLNQLINNFQLKKLRQFIQNAIDKS